VDEGDVVTFSAGVAELAAGESGQAAVQRADDALYAAKAAGRDRTRIAPTPIIAT
jgi:diguanylate cyclase